MLPWRPFLLVGATALVVIVLNIVLIRLLRPPASGAPGPAAEADEERTAPVEKPQAAPAPAVTDAIVPPKIKQETPARLEGTATIKSSLSPMPLAVTIKRLEPAAPRAGESLEVILDTADHSAGKLTYQYRVQPETKWQSSDHGRIKLTRLPPGAMVLEVRAMDETGRTSPLVTKRLTVKSAEKTATRFRAGDKFYQEVIVTRRSAYQILGVDIGQNVQYGFVSSFHVDKVNDDGSVVAKQRVETARFGEGDAELQKLLADSLKKTEGATFEMTVGPRGEITRFKGADEPLKVFGGGNPLAGQTFLLWSFLDDDAWKELAQLTFLLPDKPLRKGATWTRELSHSWGPLGAWKGKSAYVAVGKQAGCERIDFLHDMKYQAPSKGGVGLPFQVTKADFKPQTAGGAILFDAERKRVAFAEETFRVRGNLKLSVAGTDATVDMDEAQHFQLRILEQKPRKEAR